MGVWSERAACRGMTTEAFFGRNLTEAREALRICGGCMVQKQCLDYAIREDIHLGVWGGMTERQRRAEIRQRIAS